MEDLDMFSIGVRALRKVNASLQQFAANRLFVTALIGLSWRRCLMASARVERAAVAPYNRIVPAGFHHHCTPFLPGCRGARSCDPMGASKGSRQPECRKASYAVHRVDGDAGALADDRPLRNVVITGANRGLGFAIADYMLDIGEHRVVLACRSQQEGNAALERLRANQEQRRHRGTLPTTLLASVHPLDVSCPRSLESFRENCVNDHLGGRVDVLFNNAGVCLTEDGDNERKAHGTGAAAAAAGALRETLAVNFFGALAVADACMPALMSAAATVAGARMATTAEESTSAVMVMPLTPPTVVWISSGEGELCFLGAKWRRLLAHAENLEEIKSHMSDLLASARASEKNASSNSNRDPASGEEETREEEEEMAFGPTPAYSLSKAAANAAVRAWAPRLLRPPAATAPTPGSSHTGGVGGGVRLIAVCPGDVLTRMTTAEEVARGDAVSPKEAAAAVVKIAISPAQEFPAGKFYRHGQEIGW